MKVLQTIADYVVVLLTIVLALPVLIVVTLLGVANSILERRAHS